MNEENDRKPRIEEAEVVSEEVNCVSREKIKNALRRIKKVKPLGRIASRSLEVRGRDGDRVFHQTVQQTING